jgi:hypothetical protein
MIPPVELPETFKMTTLQIPRRGPTPARAGPPQSAGPTEMSLPSISFSGGAPLACKVRCPPAPGCDSPPAVRELSGSWISLLYLNVGLLCGLSLLAVPSAGQLIAWLVCPVWSTAVVAHGFAGDNLLFACGVVLALAYPVVVTLRDFQLDAAYLLLFAGFASRGFWREQRGVWLVLCVVCWAGVLAGAGGLLVFEARPGLLESGCLSALALGVVCTRRLGRFRYKIVNAPPPAP